MNDQLPLTVRPVWTRTTRVPVARTVLALVVFLGALLSVVVFTLNRNASRATRQHAATQLAGAARVAASTLAVDRANLRARAGQIVGSIDFQQVVATGDGAALARIATAHRARLEVGERRFGALPGPPRLTSTASFEKVMNVSCQSANASNRRPGISRLLRSVTARRTPRSVNVRISSVRSGRCSSAHRAIASKSPVRSGNGADPEHRDQCRRGRAAVEGDDEQQRVRTADGDRGDPDAADRDRSCHSVRAPGCTDLR